VRRRSVAGWILASGPGDRPVRREPGTAIGWQGRISVSQDERGVVWIGGATRTVVHGEWTTDDVGAA
jgi:hypothetical protein